MTQPIMLTEQEMNDAKKALIAWFQSQELSPGNASAVMGKVLAQLMVDKSKNVIYLMESTAIFTELLVAEVIGGLRK